MMITPRSKGSKLQRLIELQLAQQESLVVDRYRRLHVAEYDQKTLKIVTGIEKCELVHRLYWTGFRGDNVMALNALPVAMTAWASGCVTADEKRIAENAVLESELLSNGEAMETLRTWLKNQPSSEYWQLWEDFTRARAEVLNSDRLQALGRAVITACQKVAWASGGMWGIGKVSPAEQRVMDRAESTFKELCHMSMKVTP